ncbi:hypothetical protein A6E01_17555 [Vibrio breoganii]|uniref:N-acetyltransferase domain-containing protein n=1 Tax=Vibrio breoganii TaxID=553239 RepID=A0AAN0XYR3_9VIBR|nr:GNAT family N-acetyltransferase [Vibrio breoganii]ANO34981.1 hypothetical protein A6E01_17555 [Vibrio breoganii]
MNTSDIIFKEFDERYLTSIIKLLKTVFSEVSKNDYFSNDFFSWKHLKNPYGKSKIILAINEDNEVIAFRSFMMWEFDYGDEIVKAYRPVDTAVHPNYQGKGLFNRLTSELLAIIKKENALIFNTPNKNSLNGYLKMGWKLERPIYFNVYPNFPVPFVSNDYICGSVKEDIVNISEYEYTLGSNHTKISKEYLKWRYHDNPSVDYSYCKVNSNTVLIIRVVEKFLYNELLIIDILTKSKSTQPIVIDSKKIARSYGVSYLLVTRDIGSEISVKNTLRFKPNFKKFQLVSNDDSNLEFFDDIVFSIRDLEMF